jgi:hypothetical protein
MSNINAFSFFSSEVIGSCVCRFVLERSTDITKYL